MERAIGTLETTTIRGQRMNRERCKELLPIMQAFADGKAIQFRSDDHDEIVGVDWLDLPDDENLIITFPADDYEYRIKPEPREFWIETDDVTGAYRVVTACVKTNAFKVREVTEEMK